MILSVLIAIDIANLADISLGQMVIGFGIDVVAAIISRVLSDLSH